MTHYDVTLIVTFLGIIIVALVLILIFLGEIIDRLGRINNAIRSK